MYCNTIVILHLSRTQYSILGALRVTKNNFENGYYVFMQNIYLNFTSHYANGVSIIFHDKKYIVKSFKDPSVV